nr:unnamed protein product [Callosobruchus chinensis]
MGRLNLRRVVVPLNGVIHLDIEVLEERTSNSIYSFADDSKLMSCMKLDKPITLLNIMGKILEKIIYERIQPYAVDIIPSCQHGFMPGKGTATQILRTTYYIADALEHREHVALLITDLTKAFDSIGHNGLIYKLKALNFPVNLTKIIENHLRGLKLRGRLNNDRGAWTPVPFGFPQGSILGPWIWNLYMADLPVEDVFEPVCR